MLRIYNDFYVDIQEESGGRLVPQAILPIWDMDLTIAEMERLLDQGIRGFTLSDKPELLGLPELPEPYFEPMWDLFNESGAVVNFHIGAGQRKEEMEKIRSARYTADRPGGVRQPAQGDRPIRTGAPSVTSAGSPCGASQMYMSNVRIVANLCMSDLFDRYPNLQRRVGRERHRLGAVHARVARVPARRDGHRSGRDRTSEAATDGVLPATTSTSCSGSSRCRRQKLIDDIGVNNVLVETDVPHPTCLYPGAREHFAEVLGGLDEHTRRRVLHDNAAELYRIEDRAV